jgi:hypothetical protein
MWRKSEYQDIRTIPGIIVRYQPRGRRRDVITVAADEGKKRAKKAAFATLFYATLPELFGDFIFQLFRTLLGFIPAFFGGGFSLIPAFFRPFFGLIPTLLRPFFGLIPCF